MHAGGEATLATPSSHRKAIDQLIEAAGGHITSTVGDSVFAEFASVVEAVEAPTGLAPASDGPEPDPAEAEMAFRKSVEQEGMADTPNS